MQSTLIDQMRDAIALLLADERKRVDEKIMELKEVMTSIRDGTLDFVGLKMDLMQEKVKGETGQVKTYIDAAKTEYGSLTTEISRWVDRIGEKSDAVDDKLLKTDTQLQLTEKLIEGLKKREWNHCGPYKVDVEYSYGDMVCRDGSTYVCVCEKTDVDPRTKTDVPHWRLMAGRGEPGRKGEQGPRGEKGIKGSSGADGVSFIGVEMSGTAMVLVSTDGKAHRVDIGPAISDKVNEVVAAEVEKLRKELK